MRRKIYEVNLSIEEIQQFEAITHKGGNHIAKTIMHANILLHTNDMLHDRKKDNRELAELVGVSPTTINQVRKTYATEGLQAALNRRTRLTPPNISKITGDFEAHVVATALSPAPKGKARWTLRLLAEHCMEKDYIISISHSAIGDILNTNQVNTWQVQGKS